MALSVQVFLRAITHQDVYSVCYLWTKLAGLTSEASMLLYNTYIIAIKANWSRLYHEPWLSVGVFQGRYLKPSALAWYGAHRRWNGLILVLVMLLIWVPWCLFLRASRLWTLKSLVFAIASYLGSCGCQRRVRSVLQGRVVLIDKQSISLGEAHDGGAQIARCRWTCTSRQCGLPGQSLCASLEYASFPSIWCAAQAPPRDSPVGLHEAGSFGTACSMCHDQCEHLYTLRQSVIVRPMHPSPATSTTFSCQLNRTLIPAPADSFAAPGRPPTWLNPVAWGVTLVGVRGALPPGVDAMPLYLTEGHDANVSSPLHVGLSCVEGNM